MTSNIVILSRQYIRKIFSVSFSLKINRLYSNAHILAAKKFKMNEAFLRYDEGKETFDFSFRFINNELNIDRQFNLSRRTCESVYNFLTRIDVNIEKFMNKKRKKKSRINKNLVPEEETIDNVKSGNTVLFKGESAVSLDDSCIDVLSNPSNLSILIMGVPYAIKFNSPWIIDIRLPTSILAGFPVYPVEFESLYLDREKSKFIWFKVTDPINKIWQQIGEGFIYTPTVADIGSLLKLKCLPSNASGEGPEHETVSNVPVEAGPGVCPFEARHIFTNTKLFGNEFRILSYNILANTYADSDYSRQVLFSYCPPYALAIDYRKLLIIKELIGYNADIICLQEVDKKVYENDLKSSLSSLSYDGVYSSKGETSEGLAILYNSKRFQIINSKNILMSKSIDCNENFQHVWNNIINENAKQRFQERNTSILIVAAHSIDNPMEILIVGNTHLYFHPDADHIRLLQAYYALTACQNFANEISLKYSKCNITIMLCGDFNSTPKDGIYELITKNYIPKDHKDWSSNVDQTITDISLSHNLSLTSACGTPKYTNFTVEFADCLDYIFYETNKLQVTQVVPMPSEEELKLHNAIPSVVFPSDHIAICADLKWNSYSA